MHMFLEESQNGVHTQADIVWWGTCLGAVISHAVKHRPQCTATGNANTVTCPRSSSGARGVRERSHGPLRAIPRRGGNVTFVAVKF